MTLSLTITNVEKLDNGESLTLPLERIGALIGRSPTVDWSLPDPRNHISGTHCEVVYQDGEYLLFDRSTNGTFINGDTARLEGPHKLVAGDKITIGHYEIAASFGDEAPRAPPPPPSGWDTPPGVPPAPPPPPWPEPIPARPQRSSGWEPPPPRAPPNWSPPVPPPPRPPVGWEPPSAPPTPPPPPAWNDTRSKADAAWPPSPPSPRDGSGWGPTPPPPGQDGWPPPPPMVGTGEATDDPWSRSGGAMSGRGLGGSHSWAPPGIARSPPPTAGVWQHLEDIHDVDWVGAGFERSNAAAAPPPRPPDPAQGAWPAFLEAAGVKEASLTVTPQEAATTAGGLLRRLVAGLIVMLEARARAKSELRATGTEFRFDGNNPLKFHKDPESALIQLLNRKERSFMAPDLAAEEAFRDLQAHQIATLAAMQQALRATLDRFSPTAIRDRSRPHGLFANLLGVARDAQLWRAYEHDFEGVAQGSDEAFMDVFAKQFREAYEHAAAEMKRKR